MIMKNHRKLLFLIPLTFSLCFTEISAAPLSNSNNSSFYYQIGGARSISLPANVNVKTKVLSASYEYGLGYSCGNFNPLKGIADEINGLKGVKDKLIIGAVGAVTSAIGSLPALIMQRIDPGLYDLFQNALIRAEATIALANKTCEDYEQQIKQGGNPYGGWTDISKAIDWKFQMGTKGHGTSKVSVNSAKTTVSKNNGKHGLPWVGGTKAGGVGQAPIKSTADVVLSGYNLTLNRKANNIKKPVIKKGVVTPRLVEIFPTPKEASDFAVSVVGDVHIRTHNNHTNKTIPGHGLLPHIEKENTKIEKALSELISGKTKLNIDNLAVVSSNDVLINADVVQAIQKMHPSEQVIAISKLSSEVAMSKVMEKALVIRRMLITGKREPNISQTPSKKHISNSIEQLDRDIENIMFEKRIHTELASKTPALILQLQAQHNNRSMAHSVASGSENTVIEDGAIK